MNNSHHHIKFISVELLKFDPENPRLPDQVSKNDEAEVLTFMIKRGNVAELMGSIGEVGFFPGEPLLVVGPDKDEKFTVVEGNRRLAAVRLLLDPGLAPVSPNAIRAISDAAKRKDEIGKLPVLIYDKRKDILKYLGYRHITGVQSWGPLAKAEYLNQLLDVTNATLPTEQDTVLAKEIGSRADYVGRLLASLAVYERMTAMNFFEIEGLNAVTLDFSVLSTALSYSNIAKFIGLENSRDRILEDLDTGNLALLANWIFAKNEQGRTVLGESRNLRMLNEVVADPTALDALRSGQSLEAVYALTQGPVDSFMKAVNTAKTHLMSALHFLQMAPSFSREEASTLDELIEIANDIQKMINEKNSA